MTIVLSWQEHVLDLEIGECDQRGTEGLEYGRCKQHPSERAFVLTSTIRVIILANRVSKTQSSLPTLQ